MSSTHLESQSAPVERPPAPEFRAVQRGKLLLILEEGQTWVDGWGQIDGPWLHFLDDEDCRWQSWPLQHVRCVEWAEPVIEDDHGR